MIDMVQKLEKAGISVIWHFPGHAAMIRFVKQRCGGYQEVPQIIRKLKRFEKLFDGNFNVFDKLGNTKLQFYCPSNNMDGLNRPHRVKITDGPLNPEDQYDRNKFEAYFENAPIDTFEGIVMTMTSNPLFPIREYKVPMLMGTYPFSLISQTSNPLVADQDALRLAPNFNFAFPPYIRAGQRVDLVNVTNDSKRVKIVKEIMKNQTGEDRHGYVMIKPDPRYPANNINVPFPAVAGTRPIITHDHRYRTTFWSAVSPYLQQAFNQMAPDEEEDKEYRTEWKYDLTRLKQGNGYISNSFWLGTNGTEIFKSSMMFERMLNLTAAAMLKDDDQAAMEDWTIDDYFSGCIEAANHKIANYQINAPDMSDTDFFIKNRTWHFQEHILEFMRKFIISSTLNGMLNIINI